MRFFGRHEKAEKRNRGRSIKVLGISGSPRGEQSSSEEMLRWMLEYAEKYGAKTELIRLVEIPENQYRSVIDKICEADSIAFSSSNYWAGATSRLHKLLRLMRAHDKLHGGCFCEKLFSLIISQDGEGGGFAMAGVASNLRKLGMINVPWGIIFRPVLLRKSLVRWGLNIIGEEKWKWIVPTIRANAWNLVGFQALFKERGFDFSDRKAKPFFVNLGKEIKVLGIDSTPEDEISPEDLPDFLKKAEFWGAKTSLLKLSKMKFDFCKGCLSGDLECTYPCQNTGDDTNCILKKIYEADAVAFFSPDYDGICSELLQKLIEVMTALENEHYRLYEETGIEPLLGKLFVLLSPQNSFFLPRVSYAFNQMGMVDISLGDMQKEELRQIAARNLVAKTAVLKKSQYKFYDYINIITT